jgi:hypothetical protein
MSEPEAVPESLSKSDWAKNLSSACLDALQDKERAILCLTGQPGAGKSTLGKQIRKQGLPGIPRPRIAVIDDGVLSVPLLGIFNRRVKSYGNSLHELAPFEPYLAGKQLVVYISSRPERRLSACDIVVRVRCNEEERRQRLLARNKDGEERYRRSLNQTDSIKIPYNRFFDFLYSEPTNESALQQNLGRLAHILVAAAAQVCDEDRVLWHGGGDFDDMRDGVGGFEGGDDAFDFGERAEGGKGFVVCGVVIVDAAGVAVVAVFWANCGVVEAGGDGVGELDLAVRVREEPGFGALEDSEFAALEARGMTASHDAVAAGFDAGHFDGFVIYEGMEKSNGVAAAADAGDEQVGEPFLALEDLAAGFVADHTVKIANDHRIRVRAKRAA